MKIATFCSIVTFRPFVTSYPVCFLRPFFPFCANFVISHTFLALRHIVNVMGKIDFKYIRLNCNCGTKCHTVGLAKNAVDGMFTCDILPQKCSKRKVHGWANRCSKRKVQGWTNSPSTLRSNVPVDEVNPRMSRWVDGPCVSKRY
jgi:hypothetical protein